MGPSEKAFGQVKSILGKLDRSIDQLRQQRTTPIPAVNAAVLPIHQEPPKTLHAAPIPPARPSNSAFGRATPIRPS